MLRDLLNALLEMIVTVIWIIVGIIVLGLLITAIQV